MGAVNEFVNKKFGAAFLFENMYMAHYYPPPVPIIPLAASFSIGPKLLPLSLLNIQLAKDNEGH
jgi:hypothetical protein